MGELVVDGDMRIVSLCAGEMIINKSWDQSRERRKDDRFSRRGGKREHISR